VSLFGTLHWISSDQSGWNACRVWSAKIPVDSKNRCATALTTGMLSRALRSIHVDQAVLISQLLSLGIIFNIMLDKTSTSKKSNSGKETSYVENMSRFYRLVVME